MQLCGTRKPHSGFDLEWRHWARSTHILSPPVMLNLIVFGRKWKRKPGLLEIRPRERGFHHEI